MMRIISKTFFQKVTQVTQVTSLRASLTSTIVRNKNSIDCSRIAKGIEYQNVDVHMNFDPTSITLT